MSSETIAVFGGSFDPPHAAHVLVASWVLSTMDVDRLLVVPTWKHALGKEHHASYEHRLAMCEFAFDRLKNVEVSDVEKGLEERSRTLHTLQALKEHYPSANLRLVVGADVLGETDRWYRWDDVVALAPPVVVGRHGYALPEGCLIQMPDISSTELRQLLVSEVSPKGLVPISVLRYIDTHRLYRGV